MPHMGVNTKDKSSFDFCCLTVEDCLWEEYCVKSTAANINKNLQMCSSTLEVSFSEAFRAGGT